MAPKTIKGTVSRLGMGIMHITQIEIFCLFAILNFARALVHHRILMKACWNSRDFLIISFTIVFLNIPHCGRVYFNIIASEVRRDSTVVSFFQTSYESDKFDL